MTRTEAIRQTERYFDEGGFFADLARRVAIPTESQNPARRAELAAYLEVEMRPYLERLGFRSVCSRILRTRAGRSCSPNASKTRR